MRWQKKGLIFSVNNNFDWMQSHAQTPIVDKINEDTLRIYFATRDSQNRSATTFIEVDADNPEKIKYIHDKPLLEPGELGCFDDCGAMPSYIVNYNKLKYLYYIGWNTCITVPFRVSIGLAVSTDNGKTFERMFKGPVMDRTFSEPYFCTAPTVIIENNKWRMWYSSCTKWQIFNEKAESFYHIKYCESDDGINWQRKGTVAIDFQDENEAGIVRPAIIKTKNTYQMWYSYRNLQNYRTDKQTAYRIGFAESTDGINWTRHDSKAGISLSETGWDSVMQSYPYIYRHRGKLFMIYNGNGFGQSGFGYAVSDE
jgi:hypothetical protein